MKENIKKTSYDFITIKEINNTLTANVALHLQKYIQLNLKEEYKDNFIVCKLSPKTEDELKTIFELNEALKQANYIPSVFSLIDSNNENTPYYLKIEWPMVKQER